MLRRWGVGEGDRIVFYDDIGLNRRPRGYWLLRLYRYPKDAAAHPRRRHRGLATGRAATTTEVPEARPADGGRKPVKLGERDDSIIATYDEVLAWSRESSDEPDAPTGSSTSERQASGWAPPSGEAGGHIPGARNRLFSDLLTDEGTFRPVDEML